MCLVKYEETFTLGEKIERATANVDNFVQRVAVQVV